LAPSTAQGALELDADIRAAIEQGRIRIAYQPIVRADDHRIVAAEALSRFQHPHRGDVPPDVFLPVAARLGLMGDLTAHVLSTACSQLVAWKKAGQTAADLSMSVNLSADDLVGPRLIRSVCQALDASGLDPRSLVLEVTEIGMVRDTESALACLRAARRLDVRIAVDDFGTGYSSLSLLKMFPVDVVKIDKSLASKLGRDAEATALVRGIVSLARSLGLTVVAEGVENDVQLEALRQLGCPFGQGFFFCRPVGPEEFPRAISAAPAPDQDAMLARARLEVKAGDPGQHLGLAVLDALPASVAVLGPDGTIMATNLAWKRFTLEHDGHASSCGVGANYLAVCENARGAGAEEAFLTAGGLRAVLSGDREDFSLEYDCSDDGGPRRFILNVSPLSTGSGAVLVAHLDITGRHLAEVALAESEERFRSIFDQAPLGIFRLGTDGRIVDANRALCELVGRSPEELEGSLRADLFDDPVEATERPDAPVPGRAGHDQEGRRSSLHRARRPDGTVRTVQVNDVVVHDQDGGRRALVATVEDITERLHLAEDLRRAQQMEALGQLAAGIAHEVNTPTQFISDNLSFLGNIWGPVADVLRASREAAAWLRHGEAPGEVAARLEACSQATDLDFVMAEVPTALAQSQEGVERVATIVRAMKAFGRPDRTGPEATDLNRLVSNAITVARSEVKNVADVVADYGPLPAVTCFPGAISQVLLNLLVNAAHAVGEVHDQAGRRGQITLKTWADGDEACISVSDTGPGIARDVLPRIFQPFFTTKPFGRGTGQGLAMAWAAVVDRHRGHIDVSTSEAGATFTIRLPVRLEVNDAVALAGQEAGGRP
jgi:PAS domain S-box-containing protein